MEASWPTHGEGTSKAAEVEARHDHPHMHQAGCCSNQCSRVESPLSEIPSAYDVAADVDANPENYVQGKLKPVHDLQPSAMPVYKGMKVYLTRNVRKDVDFINGMEATVLKYDDGTGGLLVRTATGYVVSVWPWTDPERGGLVYYPVRPGYASTILKFRGAELPHVVVYLDAPRVPAAAYTAISRVGYYKDFLLAGILTEHHFTPAK